jgi:hypothetical protein
MSNGNILGVRRLLLARGDGGEKRFAHRLRPLGKLRYADISFTIGIRMEGGELHLFFHIGEGIMVCYVECTIMFMASLKWLLQYH